MLLTSPLGKCSASYYASVVTAACSSEQHERFKDWERYDNTEESYCDVDGLWC